MEKLINGFKSSARKKQVKPYLYHDGQLTVHAHYTGIVTCVENGRKLWNKTTEIERVSRGGAIKDAQILTGELIRESFYKNNPDIKAGT
jgi:hypothetical protein